MGWLLFFILVVVLSFVVGLASNKSKDKYQYSDKKEFVDEDYLKMRIPKKIEKQMNDENFEPKLTIKTTEALAYARTPEIREGERLKYSDPKRALEILLPLCDVEKGKYVKHICLQCYRNLKDYESEKKMIFRILEQIENVSPEDCDELEYKNMKASEETYYKRLNWVNTLIERKRVKEEKEKAKNCIK